VSINRADNQVVIKRKVPCGPDNQGTYFVFDASHARVDGWNFAALLDDNSDKRRRERYVQRAAQFFLIES
jgi:hypothetical protein